MIDTKDLGFTIEKEDEKKIVNCKTQISLLTLGFSLHFIVTVSTRMY